jgi:hypothetical protein
MSAAEDPARTLIRELARTARGPKREGVFALWLTVRVAQDIAEGTSPSDRGQRRRVQALEKRLSSLTLPPQLRRALGGALAQLREVRPQTAAAALAQLVAPTRDALGTDAGEAVQAAARAAHHRVAASVGGR